MKILIAGEHSLITESISELKGAGHVIDGTGSPHEALFTYASKLPDMLIFAPGPDVHHIFSSIREVNPEADALFLIDTKNPDSFEDIIEFQNISFLPVSSSKKKFLRLIEEFRKQVDSRKKNKADAQLYDLILQSLPFPALLLHQQSQNIIFANKAARDQLGEVDLCSEIPFIPALSDEVSANLFSDIEAYRIHSLKAVPAYDRYWDLTIEQVAPSVFMLLAIDATAQRQQMQFREEMERITRHDLRSPTATIVGMARMLETDAGLNAEYQPVAESLRKTSERMIRQIDTSLTLIRLETGSLKADSYPFNLYTAISAAVGDLSQLIQDKNLEIKTIHDGEPIQEECSIVCFGEAALIITMFSNLLKNAAEAAPENSPITIRICEEDQNILTEIHNFGEIPESIRNNFFDRYATYGKKNGTGLGTYSARLIARASGGDITFTTSAEKGTTLITTIPKP